MKKSRDSIKAVFFDLWNSLITGPDRETITEWYKKHSGVNDAVYNREECMLIPETDPEKFLEAFLEKAADSHNTGLLLGIKEKMSPERAGLLDDFVSGVKRDCGSMRWLPGALDALENLKGRFILVGISNAWGYQQPYFMKELKVKKYFDHVYLSCEAGLDKMGMIEKAAADLKLRPQEILMVGDRYDNDILPAVKLGIRALRINPVERIDPMAFLNEVKRVIGPGLWQGSGDIVYKPARKCLFIIPPYYKMLGSHNNRINLGIAPLVHVCAANGIEPFIFHADSAPSEEYPTRYQMLLNSGMFYSNMSSNGIFQEISETVRDIKPDVIVITSGDILNSFTDTGCWSVTLKTAMAARQARPGAYILSYGPEHGDSTGSLDGFITSEADSDFIDIINMRPRGRINTSVVPEPALEEQGLLTLDNFVGKISKKGFDITYWRRGCFGKCHFCRVVESNKGGERFRPIETVMEEVSYRRDKLGLRNIYMVDPNFTSFDERTRLFCSEMKKNFPDVTWKAESRFDTLGYDIIPALKEGGCSCLKLGLENALGEEHQAAGKKVPLADAKEKIKALKKAGIRSVIYLMLGGYWYTEYDYERMYENALSLGADSYTVSIMTPYVGTASGISYNEWNKWGFTGSHLDIRLVDYWKIPVNVISKFYGMELAMGREDKGERRFVNAG